MGAKRRRSIMREGARNFAPDCDPDFRYGGKVLSDRYDKQCYLEGWFKADADYESSIRESEEGINE